MKLTDISRVWAMMPEKIGYFADAIAEVNATETEALADKVSLRSSTQNYGSTAVLPLYGPITQRYGLFTHIMGGTSADHFGLAFDAAVNNPSVSSILIDVDSPGGSTYGITELSNKIRKARGSKPIVAVANSLCASAAYWVASAADQLFATPSSDVGSIGVLCLHSDYSTMFENTGIKNTFIFADGSPYKVEGNQYEPLTEEARNQMQNEVDEFFEQFVADLARNREVSKATIRTDYGQGRCLSAKRAFASGMIDGICTLEELLKKQPQIKKGKHTSVLRKRIELMD